MQSVIAQRFVLSAEVEKVEGSEEERERESGGRAEPKAVGVMILHDNIIKRRIRNKVEVLAVLRSEADRIAALQRYFGIKLSEQEQRGIRDLSTELRGGFNKGEADENPEQDQSIKRQDAEWHLGT